MTTKTINFLGTECTATSMRIGDTMEVFIGDGEGIVKEIDAAIKKGLAKGESVTRDGVKTFHTHDVIMDSSKEGSAAFIWDKSGERVKHNKILVTIRDGERTEEVIGTCFRSW